MSKKRLLKYKSIKGKVLTIPLLIIFIIVMLTSILAIYISKSKLLVQIQQDGINLAQQVSNQMGKSNMAMDTVNQSIEGQIRDLGKFLSQKPNEINNEYLVDIAKCFNVDEINFVDQNGNVIYSNVSSSIGAVFGPDHISYSVISGKKNELMEKIRKSRETNNYYKYGYVIRPGGGMIQVGILANKVNELMVSLEPQTLVEDMIKNKNIVYACFIDKNLKVVAHSDKKINNQVLNDDSIKNVIQEGKVYSEKLTYGKENKDVYDIKVPVYKNGVPIGVLGIGVSMENVRQATNKIIVITISIAIVCFIISAIILYSIVKSVINPLQRLAEASKKIADGDLNTVNVNVKSNDEIGVLSDSFGYMCHCLRHIVGSIKREAEKTKGMSTNLTSNAKEITSASNEVAVAIQEVTKGASNQANNLVETVKYMQDLTKEITNVENKLLMVKDNSDKAKNEAEIGKDQIDALLKSIEEVKTGFNVTVNTINKLNSSVSQISNITYTINEISDQTNLLALNAAIEAARAGQLGKGFAVVADEIKKLADQSKQSTEQIQELVESIINETGNVINNSSEVKGLVENQMNTVLENVECFEKILKSIEAVVPLIDETYSSLYKTKKSNEIVSDKIREISAIAEETSASSEEISSSSEEMLANSEEVSSLALKLSEVAIGLNDETNKFKL
ncbi:methyl-accepting chemotaxis protein [Clostridium brassicae]|uniref:Methyl-accepting chemotaxis protein n=1 Tax=Clostridium brassicae TaxID=2999072 RepID=A0ABT4DE60_9CLOT|nr:methyl-accepting chemotaxis protein [Clostridium brassicae]MCY6960592.1 methyl-accepting chemotaxis protein [Clostridium brassicae]